jgi:hypothetical protein
MRLAHKGGARSSGVPDLDADHLREQPSRFDVRDVGEIGDKRYRTAPSIAAREVRPPPGHAIDLERSEVTIRTSRIERDVLFADSLAAREEAP